MNLSEESKKIVKDKINKLIIKRAVTIILILIIVLGSIGPVFAATQSIIVELNGKPLEFDVEPLLINGRTMVPLRGIFESLGLKVEWDAKTQRITGIKEELEIELTVGKQEATINGNLNILDSPPIIINNRTLVPIRFISEATGLKVDWNQATKTVIIKELPKINIIQENNNEFVSGYYKDDFLNLRANGSKLEVDGRIKDIYSCLIEFQDVKGNSVFNTNAIKTPNGMIKTTIDLSNHNGSYYIALFVADNSNYYNSYHTNIPVTVKEGKILFGLSPTYDGNYKKAIDSSRLDPEDYLSLAHIKEDERKVLINLAKEITKGLNSDYDKLIAIHNWITNNIYYNYDAYYSGDYGMMDAYGTYENRRSVCQGFAELTLALGRAVGIPTRLVSGYALGVGSQNIWDKESLTSSSNHAWNEAFVDNRWIIIDTTWDTFNKFIDGEFIDGMKRLRYFDISLQYFSATHRIINNR